MNNTIRKEMFFPQSREQVWQAVANREALADWMYPNDFEPRVGHAFTFRVPANPAYGFEGLIVRCKVLECNEPSLLVFSWSAGGAVENTRVSFHLEPEGDGTRLHFEHTGFDLSKPEGHAALHGAEYGWGNMIENLRALMAGKQIP